MARTKLPAKTQFGDSGYRFRRYRNSKTVFTVRVRMEPDAEHPSRWWSEGRRVTLATPDDKAELLSLADAYAYELTHPYEVAAAVAAEDERHQPLAAYLDCWRTYRLGDTSLKGGTLDREEVELSRIAQYLGDRPLCLLTPADIEDAYARMASDGVSDYSRARAHAKLKAVLEHAIDDGLLTANPAARVRRNKPRAPKRNEERMDERRVTPNEADALAARIYTEEPDGLRAAIWLARYTGMRRGEVLGLRWSDIDTDARIIHVRRQLDRNRKLRDPKTPKARRDIPYLPPVMSYLFQWREKQREQFVAANVPWSPSTLICTNRNCDPFTPANLNRALRVYFAACGLGEFTDRTEFNAQRRNKAGEIVHYDCTRKSGYVGAGLHSLRHTYATELVSAGVNPKVAQELLGHEDIQTTLNLYAEVLPEDKVSAVAALSARQFGDWYDMQPVNPYGD